MTSRPKTPLLDTVNTPDDLRKLGKDQLRQLADELRAEMIDAVGQTAQQTLHGCTRQMAGRRIAKP